jgi:hypothetical protein
LKSQKHKNMKQRLFYLLLTVTTIIIALFLRKMWLYLPYFINIWIGDFLWAIMMFWAIRVVFLHFDRKKVTIGLIVFCWFIEASQAFHTPWLDTFRDTTFGGLLLGHGFLWSDIVSYTVGIMCAYFVDKRFLLKKDFI